MLALLVGLWIGLPGGAWAAPEPAPDAVRRGSAISFHGWSRDSKYVAYTRTRYGARGRVLERQRLHRRVRGGEFAGFGKMVGGDVEGHAQRSGYAATPLPWRQLSELRLELMLGATRLVLELDVGREHGWRLWHEGRLLARHQFDRIYVGFQADLFPSPNGRQAIVVMHLDSGWDVDAAAFPLDLSALTKARVDAGALPDDDAAALPDDDAAALPDE